MMGSTEEDAAGWNAIREAARVLYGDQQPRHWATLIKWALGGPDPLDGIDCYEAGESWHYLSYGFSDLYGRIEGTGDRSGYGFELTFRLARRASETQPPIWPASMLQHLARYVFRTGNALSVGDHIGLGEPLGGREDGLLRGVIFADDASLPSIDTPNGSVAFIQVFGVTADELEAVRDWQCDAFAALVRQREPDLITRPSRASYRDDRELEAAIQKGIDRDGSSYGVAFTEQLDWERRDDAHLSVSLGAIAVPDLKRALRGRIPFGRPFRFVGPEGVVVLWPDGVAELERPEEDATLTIDLTPDMASAINAGLQPTRGRYVFDEVPGLELVVVPTEVRGEDDEVVEVVG
jgi:hypothetical protein